jgi:hypothetical protein
MKNWESVFGSFCIKRWERRRVTKIECSYLRVNGRCCRVLMSSIKGGLMNLLSFLDLRHLPSFVSFLAFCPPFLSVQADAHSLPRRSLAIRPRLTASLPPLKCSATSLAFFCSPPPQPPTSLLCRSTTPRCSPQTAQILSSAFLLARICARFPSR